MARLEGKTAIITGGSSGIGHATCQRFGEEGSRIMIFDINEELGRQTEKELQAQGFEAAFQKVDVRDENTIKEGVLAVERLWGGADILINCAAMPGANKMAHECSSEEWDLVFDINVRGVFLCTKHALPYMMKKKNGSIVNFSSIYGLIGNIDLPPYHAAKGAVLMMTKTDAICYAPHGIRVNAVHPGSVKTPLFLQAGDTYPGGREAYIAEMSKLHPLRLGEPVDVANCVLFLASEEARFVTGASLVCDGGYTAQ